MMVAALKVAVVTILLQNRACSPFTLGQVNEFNCDSAVHTLVTCVYARIHTHTHTERNLRKP